MQSKIACIFLKRPRKKKKKKLAKSESAAIVKTCGISLSERHLAIALHTWHQRICWLKKRRARMRSKQYL
jgi:hypothetical protein